MADRSISATVHDPGAVALAGQGSDSAEPREILAGDGAPRSVNVAAGTFSTGENTSASFELDADRLADKSLRLRWARPPIVGGELHTLVPANGRITFTGTDDASLFRREDGRLRLALASSLSSATDDDGGFVGYTASTTPVPSGALGVSVPLTLETPLGNVVEVRRKVSPRRGAALAIILLTSALAGAFGGAYVAAAPGFGKGTSGETAFRAVGWSVIGVGGTIDLFALPTLLAPSTNEVVQIAR
jgi:hypothetical protein